MDISESGVTSSFKATPHGKMLQGAKIAESNLKDFDESLRSPEANKQFESPSRTDINPNSRYRSGFDSRMSSDRGTLQGTPGTSRTVQGEEPKEEDKSDKKTPYQSRRRY